MGVTHFGYLRIADALRVPAVVCPDVAANLVGLLSVLDLDPALGLVIAPAPSGQHVCRVMDHSTNTVLLEAPQNACVLPFNLPSAAVSATTPRMQSPTLASCACAPVPTAHATVAVEAPIAGPSPALLPVTDAALDASPSPGLLPMEADGGGAVATPFSPPVEPTAAVDGVVANGDLFEHMVLCALVDMDFPSAQRAASDVTLPIGVSFATSTKCNQGQDHGEYAAYWKAHAEYGHVHDDMLKIMVRSQFVDGGASPNLKFPP